MTTAAASVSSLLDQVEILRALPPQLKQQLEGHLTDANVRAGAVVFSEGDPGDAMYLLVSGEVSVFLSDRSLGLSVELARLGAGQVFGEMALVTGSPRSATVKATEDSRLKVLSREILFKLVQAAPQVGLMIAGVLAKRTEELNRNQWIEFGTLKGRSFDPALVDVLPLPLIKKFKTVPVARGQGTITIATCDASNRVALDDVKELLSFDKVRVIAVSEADFNAWVTMHFSGTAPKTAAKPAALNAHQLTYLNADRDEDKPAATAAASTQDIALLLSTIILEAIEKGASDIHFEPERRAVSIRYRVDGQLVAREGSLARPLYTPLVSRLKVLAGLNITERRLPQDGRLSTELNGKPYDLRIATVATRHGEKVTLRVLDGASIQVPLNQLIGAEKVAQVVRKLFAQPTGLILVTGPTGSGKTTTLYSALRERMGQPISLCTVEDPIEYDLPGVSQIQVNEASGLGFPEVLRSLMRLNPDVVFVGEMRDEVTAKLACTAALTGHLVISSLHTNDALSAITRLQSMGVEPYVVGGALLGLINQRLVRRICAACRTETTPPDSVLQGLRNAGVSWDPAMKFYRGRGCGSCNATGSKGRVGLFELLVVNANVRDAITQKADASALRAASMDGSYVSHARYGSFVLSQGVVDPSELVKILPRDQVSAAPQ
jgi:type IV pilus assembly protein PilB